MSINVSSSASIAAKVINLNLLLIICSKGMSGENIFIEVADNFYVINCYSFIIFLKKN